MSTRLQEIERLASALSVDERLDLIQTLLSDLAQEEEAVAEEWRKEVQRRLQEWHHGSMDAVDSEEVLSQARALLA
jgi:putative addiction module component (TIGR02574 family)